MAKKVKTKAAEISKLSGPDLQKELDQSYRQLFALRLQRETLQLQNHRELPRMRRNIARIKTFLRQKELATASRAQAGAATVPQTRVKTAAPARGKTVPQTRVKTAAPARVKTAAQTRGKTAGGAA